MFYSYKRWANALNLPIISIDYRLSPKHLYPKAIDDVWQVYNWILKHAETELKIKPKRIIITGDSAGGTLTLSLTYLILLFGVQMPYAIFPVYPALRFRLDYFSPSILNSLNNPVLPFNLHSAIKNVYLGKYDRIDDPFVNNLYASDNILKKMPITRFIYGTNDFLRDDGLRLFKRLIDLNIDAKLIEFKHFGHGFLSFDSPFMLPEASVTNDVVINEMKKVINKFSS